MPKPKIAVVGAGGMLGSVLVKRFSYDGYTRAQLNILDRGDVDSLELTEYETVINCAGIPNSNDPVNSYGVQCLRNNYSGRIIHISTDCVFSSVANHSDLQTPDPDNTYGASKRLGELFALRGALNTRTCVVRTSFVGTKHGLLPWFLRLKPGSVISGWVRAYWSGSTVDAVAEKIADLVNDRSKYGVIHIATEKPITKYALLNFWNELYNSKIRINVDYEHEVHRALIPTKGYTLDPVMLRIQDFMRYKNQIQGLS